jgi:hypothetical protein
MPSIMNEMGCIPVAQRPTCSKMCNKHSSGPQTAIDLHQKDLLSSSHIQHLEGLSSRLHIQCDRGAGNEIQLNLNVKHKKKLTSSSVSIQEQSIDLYSPKTTPKVLDKHVWHIDDKLRTEAHYAPQPKGRDHINNAMRWREKELTTKHQWSQHDIHHEIISATQGRIINTKGLMDVGMSTNMIRRTGKAIQKPACDDDDDWLLLGPKCGAKNNTEQLSEDSDELSEVPNYVRESDEDLTGSLPETVHMACMRDHHHYTVYRDMNDGEGPS